jgi:N-acetylmuramoyl-L-alanine amidase
MAIVKYTESELNNLARLMRAEAVGDGDLGMLMVGNVVINRTIAECYTFKNTKTINDVIYVTPGGFAGARSNLFYSYPTIKERELAKRVINGEYYYPATNALWFYAPSKNENCTPTWYEQINAGRYKSHCFYEPNIGVCPKIR